MRCSAQMVRLIGLLFAPSLVVAAAELETVVIDPAQVQAVHFEQGTVEAIEGVSLTAEIGGRVVWVGADLDDYVAQGEVVLRLRDEGQQAALASARADLAEAAAQKREADESLRRFRSLVAKKVATQAQLDKARAAYDSAVARHAATAARISGAEEQLRYTRVEMPFSGVIKSRLVEPGEVIATGKPLFEIVSLTALRVVASVPQSLVNAVRASDQAWIELPGGKVAAKQMTLAPGAEVGSHTVKVRLGLPAGDLALLPGMFVRVSFVIGSRQALLLPERAVVRRSEVVAVYVVAASGQVVMRQIRLGRRWDGDQLEVLAGLASGERIALDPVRAALILKQQRRDPPR